MICSRSILPNYTHIYKNLHHTFETLKVLWDSLQISKQLISYFLFCRFNVDHICSSSITTFLRHYSGFHSLIIAVSRYVFIVFNGNAEKIGVKRLRTFFILSSLEVPMLLTIVEFLFYPAKDWISHFRFSDEYPLMTNHSEPAHHSIGFDVNDNVFYLAIQRYIPPAPIGIIKRMLLITVVIIYSNIAEGLIYGHIFMFTYRYENSIL